MFHYAEVDPTEISAVYRDAAAKSASMAARDHGLPAVAVVWVRETGTAAGSTLSLQNRVMGVATRMNSICEPPRVFVNVDEIESAYMLSRTIAHEVHHVWQFRNDVAGDRRTQEISAVRYELASQGMGQSLELIVKQLRTRLAVLES